MAIGLGALPYKEQIDQTDQEGSQGHEESPNCEGLFMRLNDNN